MSGPFMCLSDGATAIASSDEAAAKGYGGAGPAIADAALTALLGLQWDASRQQHHSGRCSRLLFDWKAITRKRE